MVFHDGFLERFGPQFHAHTLATGHVTQLFEEAHSAASSGGLSFTSDSLDAFRMAGATLALQCERLGGIGPSGVDQFDESLSRSCQMLGQAGQLISRWDPEKDGTTPLRDVVILLAGGSEQWDLVKAAMV